MATSRDPIRGRTATPQATKRPHRCPAERPVHLRPRMRERFFITLGLVTAFAAPLGGQSLRGSRSSVDLMYTSARTRDLVFLNTPADIYHAAMQGALSLIVFTQDLELDKVMYPFVLPNTRRFADSLAREYHAGCGERLVVTGGARPADDQPRNASPKSVHP